jgi:hypothetical protein
MDTDEELLSEAKHRMLDGLNNLVPGEEYSPYDVAYWVTGERVHTEAGLGELCLRYRGLALLFEFIGRAEEMRRRKASIH